MAGRDSSGRVSGRGRAGAGRQDLRATALTLLRVLVLSAGIVLALYVVGLVAFMVVE
jgi:hypothetical protein